MNRIRAFILDLGGVAVKIVAGILMIAVCLSCGGCFKAATRELVYDEYRFRRGVPEAFVRWAETGRWSDARECDAMLVAVLEAEKPGVKGLFLASQFSHLRGNTRRAMSLLDKAIRMYPDATGPGTSLRVKILGRLWMGTMQRQTGDGQGAIETYEALKQMLNMEEREHRLVRAICCLNIAQVASRGMRNRELFIRETDALLAIEETSDTNLADFVDFYQKWALYARAKKTKGKDAALKEVVAPQSLSPYIVIGHANVNGMLPYHGLKSKEQEAIWKRLAGKVQAMRYGDFDKGAMRWAFGVGYFINKDYEQADTYLGALQKEDDFFSPVAGVWLAESKKKQGKQAEGLAVLEKVGAKYPGYGQVVDDRKKSWKEKGD